MTVPAFVAILPVNAVMPPVAIAELAAGAQSSPATPVGLAAAAGRAVKSETAEAVLLVSELPGRSSANWFAGVAVFAWNVAATSLNNTLRIWRSDAARSGVVAPAARANVSASRTEIAPAGKRARTPFT